MHTRTHAHWGIRHNYYYVGHISWMSTLNNNSTNSPRRVFWPSWKFSVARKIIVCVCVFIVSFLESSLLMLSFLLSLTRFDDLCSFVWLLSGLLACWLVLFSLFAWMWQVKNVPSAKAKKVNNNNNVYDKQEEEEEEYINYVGRFVKVYT